MMGLVGSLSHGAVKESPPRLRLAEEKFRAPRRSYTRSSPAMISEVQARTQGAEPPQSNELVNWETTCTAMICAPFATPEKATPAPSPLPAAMPATCVPCQHPDSAQLAPAPGPVCCVELFGQSVMLWPEALLE